MAADAALDAGAMAAIRMRREPGNWVGAKGGRVAAAALGAAALDAFMERDGQRGKIQRAAETTLTSMIMSKVSAGAVKSRRNSGGFF